MLLTTSMDLPVLGVAEDLRPLARKASATCHILLHQDGSHLAKHSLLAQAALPRGATNLSLLDPVSPLAQRVPRTSVDRRVLVLMMGDRHLSALERRDRKLLPRRHKHPLRNPSPYLSRRAHRPTLRHLLSNRSLPRKRFRLLLQT